MSAAPKPTATGTLSLNWKRHECLRCGGCVAACPVGAAGFVKGSLRLGHQCRLCLACFEVCPSGAISLVDSAERPQPGRSAADTGPAGGPEA